MPKVLFVGIAFCLALVLLHQGPAVIEECVALALALVGVVAG